MCHAIKRIYEFKNALNFFSTENPSRHVFRKLPLSFYPAAYNLPKLNRQIIREEIHIYVRKMEKFFSLERHSKIYSYYAAKKKKITRRLTKIHANFISRTEIRFFHHDSNAHLSELEKWSQINHPILYLFSTKLKKKTKNEM